MHNVRNLRDEGDHSLSQQLEIHTKRHHGLTDLQEVEARLSISESQLSEAKKALHECFVVMAGKEGTNAPFDVKRWSAAVTEAAKYWDRKDAQEDK